jgi:hypothetical protein
MQIKRSQLWALRLSQKQCNIIDIRYAPEIATAAATATTLDAFEGIVKNLRKQ